MITLRDAAENDLEAIDAIYNAYVASSDCTMQIEPGTREERSAWFATLRSSGFPVLVAVEGDEVLGWGSLSKYAERAGYRFTAENSVYLREDARGRGLGRKLLAELIARARARGLHSLIAKIVAGQTASLALHRAAGFVEVGRLPEVGRKFDRWIDVVFMQLRL
jgi:L-amino acid N-acyltransferase YncA